MLPSGGATSWTIQANNPEPGLQTLIITEDE